VTYHIGENVGGTRTGSLTIAGQIYGVVQEGR
jgi:hypothetical protein